MGRRPANRHRPDDVERPEFEFCVPGPPVSGQSKNSLLLQQWKAVVEQAARAAWDASRPLLRGDVELRVTYYSEFRAADVDNLLKPIQDVLQGITYVNDRQVKDATFNRRNINGRFIVRHSALPLVVAFSQGREFLHIRIWISPDTEDLG